MDMYFFYRGMTASLVEVSSTRHVLVRGTDLSAAHPTRSMVEHLQWDPENRCWSESLPELAAFAWGGRGAHTGRRARGNKADAHAHCAGDFHRRSSTYPVGSIEQAAYGFLPIAPLCSHVSD
jgi:hypothetical protein